MISLFEKLAAPFPKDSIHWRAQVLKKDGTSAMALAYIDARDVMDRLDDVCGPSGWQSEHFDAGSGRMGCKIGVFCPEEEYGQWAWKSDGAGATNVEADKGAFSDAFKRAAVSWGVGRYLYSLDAPWVPCSFTEYNGKKRWKDWTKSPWECLSPKVKAQTFHGPKGVQELKDSLREFCGELRDCTNQFDLDGLLVDAGKDIKQALYDLPSWYWGSGEKNGIENEIKRLKSELPETENGI